VVYNEILDKLDEDSIQFIKKLVTFIFNISFGFRTFPNLMKIAEFGPFTKKGRSKFPTIDRFQFLPAFWKTFKILMSKRVVTFLYLRLEMGLERRNLLTATL
jgi:hypothetical protein